MAQPIEARKNALFRAGVKPVEREYWMSDCAYEEELDAQINHLQDEAVAIAEAL